MAIREFDCKGYGQIEPSQVWFTRAGMSESQCELDYTVFASHFPMLPTEVADGKIVAENGAFLIIDKERQLATVPSKALADLGFKMGINYSTERIYNQFTPGRRNFAMIAGEYNPRIGFIEPGMRICTNTVAWNTADCDLTFETGITAATATSDQFYAAVKARIAAIRDNTNGRINNIVTPASTQVTPNPIYCGVIEGSKGKLCIGIDPDNAIGGVLGIVTEAYYNADNTDAFKIMFIDPAQVA